MNRKATYGKYVFRQKRRGGLTIYARVPYKDAHGARKYLYKRAASETQAALYAERMINELRLEKLDGELSDLFFSVKDSQIDFRAFKKKILSLFTL